MRLAREALETRTRPVFSYSGVPRKFLVKMSSKKKGNEEPAARRLAYQTYLEDLDDDLHRLLVVRNLYRLFIASKVSSFQGECTYSSTDRYQGSKRPSFRKGREKTVSGTQS